MALLNRMIRTVAITGRADSVNGWVAGRQSGRWAELAVHAAFPKAGHDASAETLRELTELHRRGVLTDAEFEELRAGLASGA